MDEKDSLLSEWLSARDRLVAAKMRYDRAAMSEASNMDKFLALSDRDKAQFRYDQLTAEVSRAGLLNNTDVDPDLGR